MYVYLHPFEQHAVVIVKMPVEARQGYIGALRNLFGAPVVVVYSLRAGSLYAVCWAR